MWAKAAFWFVVVAAFLPPLKACNVPVFRYALERWPAEAFDVVIFYRGALYPAEKALAESVEKTPFVNLEVTTADLATRLDPTLQKVWERQTNATLPWTVVLPPHGDEVPVPLWSGHLTATMVAQLVDSPLRRELAKRLLRGDSAVWLLLESDDKAADDRLDDLLSQELRGQEKEIALPPPDPDDPRMHANLPLRVAFSVMRGSRNDPAEALFMKMLLHGEAAPATGPMLFPIFARGRVLAALAGKDVTSKTIRDVASFICGACSCEVKELNPGKDLLLAANWNSIFQTQSRPAATPAAPAIPTNLIASSSPNDLTISLTAAKPSRRTILAIGILIAAALVVITGTMVFRRKQHK